MKYLEESIGKAQSKEDLDRIIKRLNKMIQANINENDMLIGLRNIAVAKRSQWRK